MKPESAIELYHGIFGSPDDAEYFIRGVTTLAELPSCLLKIPEEETTDPRRITQAQIIKDRATVIRFLREWADALEVEIKAVKK